MKVTEEQFKLFTKFSEQWRLRLGLTDWDVYYVHKKVDDVYARTNWDNGGRIATITLSTVWDEIRPLNNRELEKVACHEMLHVALADIVAHGEARYITGEGLERAEHTLIRRLEYAVFEYNEGRN